jgi:hypothetical protein
MAAKKTVDEIKAERPMAEFDARWGQGFVKSDFLIEEVWKTRPAAAAKPAAKHHATK